MEKDSSKVNFIFEYINQRTSGPVNAHLTPGSGIYFKAFIHYIAPGQGQTTPWGQMLMSTKSSYPFAHSLQVWKKKSDFIHIFNDFIYVYSPEARTDNPLGTNFWCQQKALITLPICCRFKKIALKSDFIYIFFMFHHMYSPGQGQTNHWGQNFDDNREVFSLCPMLQVSKWSLRNLILYTFLVILYMYIAQGRGRQSYVDKILMSTVKPCHSAHL